MATVDIETTAVAAGGESVGRDDTGRVVFVSGSLPGETVKVEITEERRSFARGYTVEVLSASADRQVPPCEHVADGCGGCDWQHVTPEAQRRQRQAIVAEALERLGKVADPVVAPGPDLPTEHYRTNVRCTVVGGRAGYRRRHSHEGLMVDDCLVAHPLIDELITEGRFGDTREVTLRAGARTGERMVVAHPNAHGIVVPDDVTVVGNNQLKHDHRAWYHEEVAGRRWRISASSFFQCRPDGAEALVDEVTRLVRVHAPDAETMVDLCSGVGLFAGTVGAEMKVVAVERHRPAVADAVHNLAHVDVKLVRASFEAWRPSRADVLVADPARSGLGKTGVAAVAASGAPLVVLVSCDAAALGRDTGLLRAAGYDWSGSTVIDMFAHTSHVEAVSAFVLR